MSLLDFIFPKFCVNCKRFGAYVCTDCFSRIAFNEKGFCSICQKPAIGGLTHPICRNKFTIDGIFSSLVYAGVVKKMVYQFKYAPHLTNLEKPMVDFFYEGLIQKESFFPLLVRESVFVPIPLFESKKRKRGYNQAELLAKGLGKKFGIPVLPLLKRVKDTQTQTSLAQKERQENMKDAFVLASPVSIKQLFLVDDVTTSGATLREAARVLKKGGADKVWGLTLAHGN